MPNIESRPGRCGTKPHTMIRRTKRGVTIVAGCFTQFLTLALYPVMKYRARKATSHLAVSSSTVGRVRRRTSAHVRHRRRNGFQRRGENGTIVDARNDSSPHVSTLRAKAPPAKLSVSIELTSARVRCVVETACGERHKAWMALCLHIRFSAIVRASTIIVINLLTTS